MMTRRYLVAAVASIVVVAATATYVPAGFADALENDLKQAGQITNDWTWKAKTPLPAKCPVWLNDPFGHSEELKKDASIMTTLVSYGAAFGGNYTPPLNTSGYIDFFANNSYDMNKKGGFVPSMLTAEALSKMKADLAETVARRAATPLSAMDPSEVKTEAEQMLQTMEGDVDINLPGLSYPDCIVLLNVPPPPSPSGQSGIPAPPSSGGGNPTDDDDLDALVKLETAMFDQVQEASSKYVNKAGCPEWLSDTNKIERNGNTYAESLTPQVVIGKFTEDHLAEMPPTYQETLYLSYFDEHPQGGSDLAGLMMLNKLSKMQALVGWANVSTYYNDCFSGSVSTPAPEDLSELLSVASEFQNQISSIVDRIAVVPAASPAASCPDFTKSVKAFNAHFQTMVDNLDAADGIKSFVANYGTEIVQPAGFLRLSNGYISFNKNPDLVPDPVQANTLQMSIEEMQQASVYANLSVTVAAGCLVSANSGSGSDSGGIAPQPDPCADNLDCNASRKYYDGIDTNFSSLIPADPMPSTCPKEVSDFELLRSVIQANALAIEAPTAVKTFAKSIKAYNGYDLNAQYYVDFFIKYPSSTKSASEISAVFNRHFSSLAVNSHGTAADRRRVTVRLHALRRAILRHHRLIAERAIRAMHDLGSSGSGGEEGKIPLVRQMLTFWRWTVSVNTYTAKYGDCFTAPKAAPTPAPSGGGGSSGQYDEDYLQMQSILDNVVDNMPITNGSAPATCPAAMVKSKSSFTQYVKTTGDTMSDEEVIKQFGQDYGQRFEPPFDAQGYIDFYEANKAKIAKLPNPNGGLCEYSSNADSGTGTMLGAAASGSSAADEDEILLMMMKRNQMRCIVVETSLQKKYPQCFARDTIDYSDPGESESGSGVGTSKILEKLKEIYTVARVVKSVDGTNCPVWADNEDDIAKQADVFFDKILVVEAAAEVGKYYKEWFSTIGGFDINYFQTQFTVNKFVITSSAPPPANVLDNSTLLVLWDEGVYMKRIIAADHLRNDYEGCFVSPPPAPATPAPATPAPVTMAPSGPPNPSSGSMAPSSMAPSSMAPSTMAPSTMAPSTMAPSTKAPAPVSLKFVATVPGSFNVTKFKEDVSQLTGVPVEDIVVSLSSPNATGFSQLTFSFIGEDAAEASQKINDMTDSQRMAAIGVGAVQASPAESPSDDSDGGGPPMGAIIGAIIAAIVVVAVVVVLVLKFKVFAKSGETKMRENGDSEYEMYQGDKPAEAERGVNSI